MRRRLRSAKRYRRKVFITQYSRVRKALAQPTASCPDPPASTVYSSSGSNSVNLERRLLEKLDDFYSSNPGRQPSMQIYDIWANEFNTEFGGVPALDTTLYQKKERMRKIYKGWKVLKVQTGLGYDPEADRVVCSDEAWQSFIKDHPLCRHFRYEGLRRKELQYNVFDKTHAADAYGYGSVTMGDASNPSVDYDFNFANSETHPFLDEDVTPPAGGRQVDTRQGPDAAGPSRRSGSLGKRKQMDATEAMAFEAMEEVRDYFRGISQTGGGSEQSVQNGGLVQCMNIMKGMGATIQQASYLFQHSKETTSRWLYAVLLAICSLKDEFIRTPDYTSVQPLIQEHGYKYRPWFDGCIGAIDGTHIPCVPPSENADAWIN
ncbi:hypothetical protein TIFTF001_046550 [Ficus carica]|uniref:Myb/SANT-like domain-containing protein n=1 Tax=Ficus carica TaxID=3494 RepID=A0AA88CU61_FICCA|nr:hypothetical protein TIFTF001_046550 [Ficus carica]